MKHILYSLALSVWFTNLYSLAQPEFIVSGHWKGPYAFPSSSHSTIAEEIFRQPQSQFLVEFIVTKCSKKILQTLNIISSDQSEAFTNILKTLFYELLRNPFWFYVIKATDSSSLSYLINIATPTPESLNLWKNYWLKFKTYTAKGEIIKNQSRGWDIITITNKISICCNTHNEKTFTLLITSEYDQQLQSILEKVEALLKDQSSKDDSPKWFEFSCNISKLIQDSHHTSLPTYLIGSIHPRGRRMFTTIEFHFAQPMEWTLNNWTIPTNIIREPIISFAAIRGLNNMFKELLPYPLNLCLPEQLYIWTVANHPFGFYGASFPSCDLNKFAQHKTQIETFLKDTFPGLNNTTVVYQPEHNRLVLSNLFFSIPFIGEGKELASNFTVFGLALPVPVSPTPPPAELLNQLSTDQPIIAYHWELTSEVIQSLLLTHMFYLMQGGFALPPTNGAINGWLNQTNIISRLGNTATIIIKESPNTLKLERSSAIGLTALELLLMCHWIDGENFPNWSSPHRLISNSRPTNLSSYPQN